MTNNSNDHLLAKKLLLDFKFFAKEQLKIRSKSGMIIPFELNKAQLYLLSRVQEQLKRTGKIRIAVLKGRQQGLSTFIGGYLYHQTLLKPGTLTFIFAHDADGSGSLYQMVKTFHGDGTYKDLIPALGTSSQKELSFPGLKSSYRVGTAGTQGLGRSKTIQQLHWSEVAYSPNCDEHAMGIMQAVPDLPGTAIFLESTSNGQGDYFHRTCMQALSGQGDMELVFIPWYWQEEYKRVSSEKMELTPYEQTLMELFEKDGLTLEHLEWRRNKIQMDFHGQDFLFKREYPFTPEEAFESTDTDAFIKSHLVRKAINTPLQNTSAPLIFGVDPARLGGDKFRICHRRGRNVTRLVSLPPSDLETAKHNLIREIEKYKPAIVNIDCGGLGVALYDMLRSSGYSGIVRKVDFGGSSSNPDRYKNKRAEMYANAKEWLEDEPCSISLDAKTADMLQSELSVVKPRWANNSQLLMEPKEEIKKKLGYSPDAADSFCFIGQTLISTPSGNKRIDSLRVGDFVNTPFGKTKIAKLWVSTANSITTVKFNNGAQLAGKGEHKIFVWGAGHCRLDMLSMTNVIESEKGYLKWIPLRVLSTMVKDIEFKPLVDTISLGGKMRMRDFYIAAFGQTILALSRKAIIYTIWTATGAIMNYPILALLRLKSICDSICLNVLPMGKCALLQPKHLNLQPCGIRPLKENCGIRKMERTLGKKDYQLKRTAHYAMRNTKPIIKTNQSSVLHPANKKYRFLDILIPHALVNIVEKILWRIGIERQLIVPVDAQTSIEQSVTYNLTLERHNVYYANGVLVYNCLTFAQPVASTATAESMTYTNKVVTKQWSWNPLW